MCVRSSPVLSSPPSPPHSPTVLLLLRCVLNEGLEKVGGDESGGEKQPKLK